VVPVENNNNSFVVTVTPITDNSDLNTSTEKKIQTTDKKEFKNQQGSIKVSSQSKEELEALMKITNTKFAHEIIDLLINNYVEKELTGEQKMKFKLLTEI
jgi:virulence-associated protein VapD